MKIDIVLMAHTSRAEYYDKILHQLGCTYQMDGQIKLSLDDGTLGVWGNAKRAWHMVNPKSDYGIVIQDDAILCDDFVNKAKAFITEHFGHTISFYFGDSRTSFKYLRPIFFDAPLYHAVALAIPTKEIPDMLKYCDTRTEVFGDDIKMRRWLISKNQTCRYSNPSLVQHRTIPSIIDPTKPQRQSAIFKK